MKNEPEATTTSGDSGHSGPEIAGILESALYVQDIERADRFYSALFGFPRIAKDPERDLFFRVGENILLLFRADQTRRPGKIPPHGTTGAGHLAFAIRPADYEAWKERLRAQGLDVEAEVQWPSGGRSLYFRDPDGNSLELATPDIWPGG